MRLAVDHRRADDPAPDDPFRGLYVNDETVDRLLGRARQPIAGPSAPAVRSWTTRGPSDDRWPATPSLDGARPASCW